MTAAVLPLIDPALVRRTVAWRPEGPATRATVLRDAQRLAEELCEAAHVVILCQNRYNFIVAFLAAILRGQTALLPNDRTERVLAALTARHPGLYGLADEAGTSGGLTVRAVRPDPDPDPDPADPAVGGVPGVPADRIAARLFTSGTTGQPVASDRSWGWCVAGIDFTRRRLGLDALAGGTVVSTVPPQHSYGFENSVLLPLHTDIAVQTARPFYPEDIGAALAAVPAPRILVTTPVHLRALVKSGTALPELALAVSATADLTPELARQVEERFGTRLIEIYGCSETGLLATRRTTATADWHLREDADLDGAGDACRVRTAARPDPVLLHDVIERVAPDRFRLCGRTADLVNIAGKRASLAGLNAVLSEIEGVVDGAFFQPESGGAGPASRLVAFVVAPGRSAAEIRAALRAAIDPAFQPRELFLVEALPRDATGKLPQAALAALARSLRSRPA